MKKYAFLILALMGFSHLASAMVDPITTRGRLNRSATAGPSVNLGWQLVDGKVQVLKCSYDFAVQGGSTSAAINLKAVDGSNCSIPNKAIVIDGLIDVLTAPTSTGSSTIAIGTGQAANDLLAATAKASVTGRVATVPVGTAATAIKMTAARVPTTTIAVAALTTGKFNVFIQYYLSD